MGDIGSPQPVLLIVAVCSRYDQAFDWSLEKLSAEYGKPALVSERFQFDQTDYYTASMGTDLRKQFVTFENLIDPANISQIKIRSNELEDDYRSNFDHPEERPLNLDPGYITESKLILASTKNHAHRIYLKDGIFAEITLFFHKKKWQKHPWTYPDYQQPEFHAFFSDCRQFLRSKLS